MQKLIVPEQFEAHQSRGALSPTLERAMITLCARPSPYRIEALALDSGAPTSLAELVKKLSLPVWDVLYPGYLSAADTDRLEGFRVPVDSANSEETIWSSPEANYLFRAWHDATHYNLGAELDIDGERAVAEAQCRFFTGTNREILWAETFGQVEYFKRWGVFPKWQRDFVRDAVGFGIDRTVGGGDYHDVK